MKYYNDWLVWILEFILPRRYWYRNFYLRSVHWRITRYNKIRSVNWHCEKCKGLMSKRKKYLDVHHLTYKNMWHEKMEDLQVLCRYHHQQEHKA